MWRLDGNEMNENEIWKLREDFIEDVFEYLDPVDWFVESGYLDKRLYFWKVPGEVDPYDLLDQAESIIELFFPGYFEDLLVERKERKMGVDFIISESDGEELNFCAAFNEIFHTNFSGKEVAWICIYDEEESEFENKITIEKEELIVICRETEEYKNRMIILHDYVQLSEEAIEYAKRQNIEIREVKESVKMWYITNAERYDRETDLAAVTISDIFGEN